jgi:hypothetical protein
MHVANGAALNKAFADMTALGRVDAPDDIGPMIASLLSPANRWVDRAADRSVGRPSSEGGGAVTGLSQARPLGRRENVDQPRRRAERLLPRAPQWIERQIGAGGMAADAPGAS